MKLLPDKNTFKLLRIPFSFYLLPVFILALSQANSPDLLLTTYSFFIIHLLVYPASNGYNSYVDRDENSIGGLEKPPMPTQKLFYLTLFMDLLAILLSIILVSSLFAICVFLYILASRAYSARQIRLKKHPLYSFLVVVFFQGAFAYLMCSIGITGKQFEFTQSNVMLLLASSFHIAGAYPLTQIYQHKQDLEDKVITLSYKLGYKGTFVFTALMLIICNVFYYLAFADNQNLAHFFILELFFLPVIFYFIFWFLKVKSDSSHANFKNTMRMNTLSALSMNSSFIIFSLLNHSL